MAERREDEPEPVDAGGRRIAGVGTTATVEREREAAIGSLIQNAACHPLASSSAPPTIGPSATATPVVAPHSPIAFARSAALRVQVDDRGERRREDDRGT